jgi:hypothetical protein
MIAFANDREAERSVGLLLRRAVAGVALLGVEEEAAQRVELLALGRASAGGTMQRRVTVLGIAPAALPTAAQTAS